MAKNKGLSTEAQREARHEAEVADVARRNSTVNQFVGGKRPSWMVDAGGPGNSDSAATTGAQKPTRTSPRRKKVADLNSSNPTSVSAPQLNALPSPADTATDGPSPQTVMSLDSPPVATSTLPPAQTGNNNIRMTTPGAVASGDTRGNLAPPTHFSGPSPMPTAGFVSHRNQQIPPPQRRRPGRPPLHNRTGQQPLAQSSINNYVNQRPYAPQEQNKRRKIDNSNQPKLTTYAPLIQHYEDEHQIPTKGSVADKKRFGYMKDALENNDYHYVALHQIFCQWYKERDFIDKIATLGQSKKLIDHGMETFASILSGISSAPIAIEYQKWFVTFPGEFDTLMNFSGAYKAAVHQVTDMLIMLVQQLPNFLRKCIQRGYPPLVDELIETFHTKSPVMQKIIFLWVRSQMQIVDHGPIAGGLFEAFVENMNWHRQLAKRINTAMPPTQRELEEVRNYTTAQYINLLREYGMQAAAVAAPGQQGAHTAPSNAPSTLNQAAQQQNARQASQPRQSPAPVQGQSPAPIQGQSPAPFQAQPQQNMQQQYQQLQDNAVRSATTQLEMQQQQQLQAFYQQQERLRLAGLPHMVLPGSPWSQGQQQMGMSSATAPPNPAQSVQRSSGSPMGNPGSYTLQGQQYQQRQPTNMNVNRANSLGAAGRNTHSPSPALQSPALQQSTAPSPVLPLLQNSMPRPASAMSSRSAGPSTAQSPIDIPAMDNVRRGSHATMPSPVTSQHQFTGHGHGHMSAPVSRQGSMSLPQGQPAMGGGMPSPQMHAPIRSNSYAVGNGSNGQVYSAGQIMAMGQRQEAERRIHSATPPVVPSNVPQMAQGPQFATTYFPQQQQQYQQPQQPQQQQQPQQHQPQMLQRPPLYTRQPQQQQQQQQQGMQQMPSGNMQFYPTQNGGPMVQNVPGMRPMIQEPRQVVWRPPPGLPTNQSIFPPANTYRAPAPPNPDLKAAHLAHLRDATLKPIDRIPEEKGTVKDRYYQSVKRCISGPHILSWRGTNRFSFTLEKKDVDMIPVAKKSRPTDPDIWEIKLGSLMYRVKLIKLPRTVTTVTESQFVTTDLTWPNSQLWNFHVDAPNAPSELKNGLDLRKKTGNGVFDKDLPIDLTNIVRETFSKLSEGVDGGEPYPYVEIEGILGNIHPHHPNGADKHAMAIEEVQIWRHQTLIDMVMGTVIPRSVTEAELHRKLNKDDDDDICMVGDLVIGLQDPWLAKLWNVPVKGMDCLHYECFDLHTFLESRPKNRKEESVLRYEEITEGAWVSSADGWRCPLCRGDARPEKLRVVQWMVDVREKLVKDGVVEDAVGVVVTQDGSWKVKMSEDWEERHGGGRKKSEEAKKKEKQTEIEVIDLDDD